MVSLNVAKVNNDDIQRSEPRDHFLHLLPCREILDALEKSIVLEVLELSHTRAQIFSLCENVIVEFGWEFVLAQYDDRHASCRDCCRFVVLGSRCCTNNQVSISRRTSSAIVLLWVGEVLGVYRGLNRCWVCRHNGILHRAALLHASGASDRHWVCRWGYILHGVVFMHIGEALRDSKRLDCSWVCIHDVAFVVGVLLLELRAKRLRRGRLHLDRSGPGCAQDLLLFIGVLLLGLRVEGARRGRLHLDCGGKCRKCNVFSFEMTMLLGFR